MHSVIKMEVKEPLEPVLTSYSLTSEELQNIEAEIERITTKRYISAYAPSILFICLLMLISAAVTGHIGPAFAGLLVGIGISSNWPEKLSGKIIEKKKKAIRGYSNYSKYKSAISTYGYESKRYLEQLEVLRTEKEKAEKKKQYQYWMEIDPWEFEKEISILFRKEGYSVQVTKGSGDEGIDIHLRKGGRKGIVQCKRFKTKVGPGPVRDFYGTMTAGNYDFGYIVCPSGFSVKAYAFGKGKNIKFLDLNGIMSMVHS